MDNIITRQPKQNRSIDKKNKIIKSGLQLFCTQGYYNTNTIDIAKHAGVSIGTLYSYFKDKNDIFIDSFKYYFNNKTEILFKKLNDLHKVEISIIINELLDTYIAIYKESYQLMLEFNSIISKEQYISECFGEYEHSLIESLVQIFNNNGFETTNIREKVYFLYSMTDNVAQEYVCRYYKNIDFNIVKQQLIQVLTNLFLENKM